MKTYILRLRVNVEQLGPAISAGEFVALESETEPPKPKHRHRKGVKRHHEPDKTVADVILTMMKADPKRLFHSSEIIEAVRLLGWNGNSGSSQLSHLKKKRKVKHLGKGLWTISGSPEGAV